MNNLGRDVPLATTSECDKVTIVSQVLKDIVEDLLVRAKQGDTQSYNTLKKFMEAGI